MTPKEAKEKVLKFYGGNADSTGPNPDGTYVIATHIGDGVHHIIGKGVGEEAAWQNAAESLPTAPEQKDCGCTGEFRNQGCKCTCTDHRKDALCLMHHAPVAPGEVKDKCEFCGQPKDNGCRHNYESGYGDFATISCSAPVAEPKPTPSDRKLEAAKKRLEEGNYKPWGTAGGPNECRHGYASGIPCQRCDRALVYDSSDMEFLAKLLTEAGAIPIINGVRIEPKSAPSNEEDRLPHRVRIAVDRITAQLGIDTAKDILYVTNELMDVWEHHSLKPQPDSSSISTGKLICKHCHKPIFADTSYTHDDGDMVCDDGNTCAAPSISTEQTFDRSEVMLTDSGRYSVYVPCGIEIAECARLEIAEWIKAAWNAAKGQSNGR